MSRQPREFTPGSTYHIMNKMSKEISLKTNELNLLKNSIIKAAKQFDIKITFFNILNNHFHLHIYFPVNGAHISKVMQWIGTQMAKTVNRILDRKGHVFFQRFTSKIIKDLKQFFNTMKYICNNSYRHFNVSPKDWSYSSYNFYSQNANDGITVDISEVLDINNKKKFFKMILRFLSGAF